MDANDWRIECSDDETYQLSYSDVCRQWMPDSATVVKLVDLLNSERDDALPSLEWTCPGRREPAASTAEQDANEQEEPKPEEKSDFDFWDDPVTTNSGARRVQGAAKPPRGSAKKKTTSLDGILSSMRRHRKLDEMDVKTTANQKTKRSPS